MTTKEPFKFEDRELHVWKQVEAKRERAIEEIEDALIVEKEVLALAQKKVSELSKKK